MLRVKGEFPKRGGKGDYSFTGSASGILIGGAGGPVSGSSPAGGESTGASGVRSSSVITSATGMSSSSLMICARGIARKSPSFELGLGMGVMG